MFPAETSWCHCHRSWSATHSPRGAASSWAVHHISEMYEAKVAHLLYPLGNCRWIIKWFRACDYLPLRKHRQQASEQICGSWFWDTGGNGQCSSCSHQGPHLWFRPLTSASERLWADKQNRGEHGVCETSSLKSNGLSQATHGKTDLMSPFLSVSFS